MCYFNTVGSDAVTYATADAQALATSLRLIETSTKKMAQLPCRAGNFARRDRRQSSERVEEALFAALCELWPQPERRIILRLVAMVSMGAMRLALESWRQDNGKRPVAEYLLENFDALEAEI